MQISFFFKKRIIVAISKKFKRQITGDSACDPSQEPQDCLQTLAGRQGDQQAQISILYLYEDKFFPIFFLKNFIYQIKGVALDLPLVLEVGPKSVTYPLKNLTLLCKISLFLIELSQNDQKKYKKADFSSFQILFNLTPLDHSTQ